MRKILIIITILISSFHLFAQFENLNFGTDSTLEVVTWNIEHFPKNGQTTVNYVRQIIEALDVDIVAIQELEDYDVFNQLVESLEGWEGSYGYNQYISLAYIYKADLFEDLEIFEIYTNNSREFPRRPLVMEMNYEGEHYVIINNHFKCCGDQFLDLNDEWDEETRRYDACNLLNDYIVENHPDDRVIILGDLNDVLTDSPQNNVFQVFTDNTDDYWFADAEIALGSSSEWSYPSWPSHIDHILMTNELFDDFYSDGSDVQTIKLDEYFPEGFEEYDYYVSDHRPVALKIKISSHLGIEKISQSIIKLTIYPNPFKSVTTISFDLSSENSRLEIYNMAGQIIKKFDILNNQSSVVWNANEYPEGIYFVKLIVENRLGAIKKMLLLK